jgi:multidrug resistance protein
LFSSFLSYRINALRSGDPGKLSVLMATAFIDMVGALMILPLLPFYAVKFGASDFMVMVLVSAFSAMQLVSAPLWGRVSDRYGRKPTLLIGLAGSAVAYVIFAYANTYWLLLVSRLVQGAGGGTTGVIQAYVADSVEPKNRAKGLGWLSAATNLGVVLGPLFGSETTRWGSHAPGLLAAVLCVLNIAFAWRYLTESHDVRKKPGAKPPRRMLDAVAGVAWHRIREPSSRLIWMYSVGIGAFYGVNALIILYLARHFNVTAEKIGPFYAYMGGLSIVFRLFVLGRTVDRFGEARTTRLGATFLALGLALIPFTGPLDLPSLLTYLPLAGILALIPLGTALNFPCVTALLSRVVGENERGLYLGVQQTYGGLARVAYPLLAGALSDHFGEGAPFWLSAAMVASTIAMGIGLERYSRQTGEFAVVEAAVEVVEAEAKQEKAVVK